MCVQFEAGEVKSWQTSLITNCIQGEIQKCTVIRTRKAVFSVYWCNFRANLKYDGIFLAQRTNLGQVRSSILFRVYGHPLTDQ